MLNEDKHKLEKIDLIRDRTGVSYREAKQILDDADWDVLEALIKLEEFESRKADEHFSFANALGGEEFTGKIQGVATEIVEQIKSVLQRGQETKIKVKQGERTVFEAPATCGAVAVLAALASSELAVLGALGTATAMAKNYTLEIDRRKSKEGRGSFSEHEHAPEH